MSKEIPKFKNEAKEREFWTNHDSTEFVDWNKAEFVSFPNLKPTEKACHSPRIRLHKIATLCFHQILFSITICF